jgi:hypothetical protein
LDENTSVNAMESGEEEEEEDGCVNMIMGNMG